MWFDIVQGGLVFNANQEGMLVVKLIISSTAAVATAEQRSALAEKVQKQKSSAEVC